MKVQFHHDLWQWTKTALSCGLLVAGSLCLSPSCLHAGDHSVDSMIRPSNWQWWHILWFHKDGTPRYGGGSGNLTRHHQARLAVRPPLCAPEFGYFQPCWRQLPVAPRCFTCETLPADFMISPYAPEAVPLPPSPVVPGALPPAEAAPASVPSLVPAVDDQPPTGSGYTTPSQVPAAPATEQRAGQ